MAKDIRLELRRDFIGPKAYWVEICNNGDQAYFIEQGALDVFSRNTILTVLAWPNNIKCKLNSKINNTLSEIKQESCITSAIDFKALCDFTKLKPGHYEIVYETTTALCDSNYLDTQCTSIDLVGNVEYLHYPYFIAR